MLVAKVGKATVSYIITATYIMLPFTRWSLCTQACEMFLCFVKCHRINQLVGYCTLADRALIKPSLFLCL